MKIIDLSKGRRETYEIKMKYSLLWESALGIAAITNEKLKHTLEFMSPFSEKNFDPISKELEKELDYVTKNNTWKSLLQLLYYYDHHDLCSFESFVNSLSEENLKFYCIPYLGTEMQQLRLSASKGDTDALEKILEHVSDNEFFSTYIRYVVEVNPSFLKEHLISVLTKWHNEIIVNESDRYDKLLKRDILSKNKMLSQLDSEAFVEWATGGRRYAPEPSVTNVLLIPHFIYRPWTVEADFEGTKVFFYPISNESLSPEDKLIPDQFLILKFKALGDETRLKIIKLLHEKEMSLQEISVQLNIAKTSVHHHLSILKSARLVITSGGEYSINRSAVDILDKEFHRFLNK